MIVLHSKKSITNTVCWNVIKCLIVLMSSSASSLFLSQDRPKAKRNKKRRNVR